MPLHQSLGGGLARSSPVACLVPFPCGTSLLQFHFAWCFVFNPLCFLFNVIFFSLFFFFFCMSFTLPELGFPQLVSWVFMYLLCFLLNKVWLNKKKIHLVIHDREQTLYAICSRHHTWSRDQTFWSWNKVAQKVSTWICIIRDLQSYLTMMICPHMTLFKLWLTFCGQYCEIKSLPKEENYMFSNLKFNVDFNSEVRKTKFWTWKFSPLTCTGQEVSKMRQKWGKICVKKISPSIWGHIEPNTSNLVLRGSWL